MELSLRTFEHGTCDMSRVQELELPFECFTHGCSLFISSQTRLDSPTKPVDLLCLKLFDAVTLEWNPMVLTLSVRSLSRLKLQQTWIAKTRCGNAENGEKAILWLGQAVSPAILQDLYSVENLDELDTRMVSSFVLSLLFSPYPDSSPSSSRRHPSPIFLPDYLLKCATFFPTSKSEQVDNCPSSSLVKISMEPKLNSQTCLSKTRTMNR